MNDDAHTGRLVALRGATAAERDAPEAITAATTELLGELLARNELTPEDVVSVIFTATPDLRSEFPAAAARAMGLDEVPLLCAQELEVQGAITHCIRVLMHVWPRAGVTPRHVYLRAARDLRTDLG